MQYRALFSAVVVASMFGFSTWQIAAEASSEDPSYEPSVKVPHKPPAPREVGRPDPSVRSAPASDADVSVTVKTPALRVEAPRVVRRSPYQDAPASEPSVDGAKRVKYILNGKPIYEGDPEPLAAAPSPATETVRPSEPVRRNSAPPRPRNVYDPEPRATLHGDAPAATAVAPQPRVYSEPSVAFAPSQPQTQPPQRQVKYILDGKPVYEGDAPPPLAAPIAIGVDSNPRELGTPSTASNAPPRVSSRASVLDDLTADKPGSAATARDQGLMEEMTPPPGELDSRAKKCYAAIGELKSNLEAISRLLDNRGKENARLVHTSEEVLKNINDLGAIWPGNASFMDACSTTKRSGIFFNDELNQVPWKWTHVRWTYNALLRDTRSLRETAKALADAEPKPVPVVGKDGKLTYVDAPDPLVDPATVRREARLNAERAELTRLRESKDEKQSAKKEKNMKTSLDN
jgi:hypothetical protein